VEEFIPVGGPDNEDSKLRERVEDENKLEKERTIDDLMRRARDFNFRLREDPKDVSNWLEYAEFQDEFVTMGSTKQKDREKVKEDGVTLEKKIAIYEKALEANPGSETLLLAHLSACEVAWE
jgi:hypothetical protein